MQKVSLCLGECPGDTLPKTRDQVVFPLAWVLRIYHSHCSAVCCQWKLGWYDGKIKRIWGNLRKHWCSPTLCNDPPWQRKWYKWYTREDGATGSCLRTNFWTPADKFTNSPARRTNFLLVPPLFYASPALILLSPWRSRLLARRRHAPLLGLYIKKYILHPLIVIFISYTLWGQRDDTYVEIMVRKRIPNK